MALIFDGCIKSIEVVVFSKASLYSLLLNFYFLVSFLFYCMHACSHQVYNSNGGLAPKIGLVLGQSRMVIPMNNHSPNISPL